MNYLAVFLLIGAITQVQHSVTLRWHERGPYTAFRVLRKPHTRSWWTGVANGITTTSWIDHSVGHGRWDYEVKAVEIVKGKTLVSTPSNIVTVNVP
jgi:hypothetical protein